MALKALLKTMEDKTQKRNALWMEEEEQRKEEEETLLPKKKASKASAGEKFHFTFLVSLLEGFSYKNQILLILKTFCLCFIYFFKRYSYRFSGPATDRISPTSYNACKFIDPITCFIFFPILAETVFHLQHITLQDKLIP